MSEFLFNSTRCCGNHYIAARCVGQQVTLITAGEVMEAGERMNLMPGEAFTNGGYLRKNLTAINREAFSDGGNLQTR